MHDIGTLGGTGSRANAVNDFGEFTGWANLAGDDEPHAFLSKPGSPLYDLGTLGGPTSHGWGVNNQIHICGWTELEVNSPVSRGFLWADGLMKSLGTLGGIYSAAFGLNDLDEVVGASTRATEVQAAFIWRQGQMYDLNTLIPAGSGWFLRAAWAIENDGTIVGEGVRPDGQSRGFLLTPISAADVPEADGDHLALLGPYPNPVAGQAYFDLVLPSARQVEIRICDVSGRARRTISRGWQGAGRLRLRWDARDDAGAPVSAGVYWAVVSTPTQALSRRITVVR